MPTRQRLALAVSSVVSIPDMTSSRSIRFLAHKPGYLETVTLNFLYIYLADILNRITKYFKSAIVPILTPCSTKLSSLEFVRLYSYPLIWTASFLFHVFTSKYPFHCQTPRTARSLSQTTQQPRKSPNRLAERYTNQANCRTIKLHNPATRRIEGT